MSQMSMRAVAGAAVAGVVLVYAASKAFSGGSKPAKQDATMQQILEDDFEVRLGYCQDLAYILLIDLRLT